MTQRAPFFSISAGGLLFVLLLSLFFYIMYMLLLRDYFSNLFSFFLNYWKS